MSNVKAGIIAGSVLALLVTAAVTAFRLLAEAPRAPRTEDRELPTRTIELTAKCRRGSLSTALWDVAMQNESVRYEFRDITYRTVYESESGRDLRTSEGTFMIVLKPGELRRIANFDDGIFPAQATKCSMEITGADY